MLGQYDYQTQAVEKLTDANNNNNNNKKKKKGMSPLKSLFFVEYSIFMHFFEQYLYAQLIPCTIK